jgi:hypothetical protein
MFTRTVGNPAVTVETAEAAGVVKVALAPPVVDRTLQLIVFNEPPVMLTLICRVDPGKTWMLYGGVLGITATCADNKAGRKRNNEVIEPIRLIKVRVLKRLT